MNESMERKALLALGLDADREQTNAIVTAVRAGDNAAWTKLDARFRKRLAVVVRGRIPLSMRSRFDTEDVLQAAIMKAFVSIDRFEDSGKGSFHRWLRVIVLNGLRDEMRYHSAGQRNVYEETGLRSTASPRSVTDREAEDLERSDALASLVERIADMDDTSSRLVQSHFLDGESVECLALRFGKSERTVRRQLGKVVMRLRAMVDA